MSYDLIVIGAGPGGYVAAIKAAQLGMKVACIENPSHLGGTCLNVGCIPSKSLLESSHLYYSMSHNAKDHGIAVNGLDINIAAMMKRKKEQIKTLSKGIEFLFNKNRVDHIKGEAIFTSDSEIKVGSQRYQAKNFLIATGSEVATIPSIPIDGEIVITSTEALELRKVPSKMLVIGGGYIGLELGSVWSRLGSKVEVVEFAPRIIPAMDTTVSKSLQKVLEKQGVSFHLNTKVDKVDVNKNGAVVHIVNKDNIEANLSVDVVLVAVGRRPCVAKLNLAEAGVALDSGNFIATNGKFQTSNPKIYAIGDVIGGNMLAHKAQEEAMAVIDIIRGDISSPHINYECIPGVIYTHPEAASIGKTEEQVKASGIEYKVGMFNFAANSRAHIMGATDGFVKIITCAKTDRLLGCHIVGEDAGTMIHEVAVLMEFGGSAEDLSMVCHAHPTLNEAIKEAAMAAYSKPIHS